MEKFKPNTLSRNPSNIYAHTRIKSDQHLPKDKVLKLPSNLYINKLSNPSTSTNKANVVVKNSSARSSSGDLKKKIVLDLSKIKITKNLIKGNNSARNEEHHKANNGYLRKKSEDITLHRSKTERNNSKENIRQKNILENAPGIQMMCSNKFYEKLCLYENKLARFYVRNNCSVCDV
ncbi:hypothetical protein SteCoe_25003 [Stentor coeruleus]|uniref:Uncharacterized protein n=1 Tax=Stentor coeruleus TaxID=5963 RepID=A0A1R2BG83_9CILI|nr:hypothetical protein SteCoe_25003 [Stentor coeruleus]